MKFFQKPFVRLCGWILFMALFLSGYEYVRERLDARIKAAQSQRIQEASAKAPQSDFDRFVADETKRIESTVQPGDIVDLRAGCSGDTAMMQIREGKLVFITKTGARWLPCQLVLCDVRRPIRPSDPEWFERARLYFSTQPAKP